jgi:hypothetical protein
MTILGFDTPGTLLIVIADHLSNGLNGPTRPSVHAPGAPDRAVTADRARLWKMLGLNGN